MPKNKQQRRPQARKGTAKAVDVAVGNKRSRAFLATIENDGQDERGRLVGANGIKWVVR